MLVLVSLSVMYMYICLTVTVTNHHIIPPFASCHMSKVYPVGCAFLFFSTSGLNIITLAIMVGHHCFFCTSLVKAQALYGLDTWVSSVNLHNHRRNYDEPECSTNSSPSCVAIFYMARGVAISASQDMAPAKPEMVLTSPDTTLQQYLIIIQACTNVTDQNTNTL